jgi:hypothetical protein
MAKLSSKERAKLPKSEFGEPGERKYPMPDASHAANAKSRAKEMLDRGRISQSQYDHICSMADAKLGEKGEM